LVLSAGICLRFSGFYWGLNKRSDQSGNTGVAAKFAGVTFQRFMPPQASDVLIAAVFIATLAINKIASSKLKKCGKRAAKTSKVAKSERNKRVMSAVAAEQAAP
jgi:hypothetical protein